MVLLLSILFIPVHVQADSSADGLSLDGRAPLSVSGYSKENNGTKLDLGKQYVE
ncbi:hypothetical protein NIE88_00120 [Sporolactobacillus shoreicorticis]|uniref:hypothetical protein n=1 Tax=Sporolactobacillus shoreicorticis TaxID=1923877 RepID=UPI002097A6B4|nr:hypothetical protein [Sporolactobacillus shoreicorticis]MCO7124195.1 hypothetical protein [Sporolactobacillus shoreicorticis]